MAQSVENTQPTTGRPDDRSLTAAETLIRLRWWLIASEIFAVAFTARFVEQDIRIAPLALLIGLQLASNLAAPLFLGRGLAVRGARALVTALLGFDIVCLTSVIHFSGGPTNPFGSLFVVHALVAVMVLPPRRSAAFAAMSCLGYATVLLLATGGEFSQEAFQRLGASMHHSIGGHLVGMWISLALTIAVATIFGGQLLRKLRENEQSLARSRAEMLEAARIASLTSFAAGAAHELSTPLSTITVVAGELSRRTDRPRDDAWDRDLALIRSEVGRCQRIIQSLRFDVGNAPAPADTPFGEALREELSLLLGDSVLANVRFRDEIRGPVSGIPLRGIAQAVAALVRNAVDASPPEQSVDLDLRANHERIVIAVTDRGEGIPAQILPTVMEPFVTTKPVGKALGLGLFLARVTCDQLHARLRLHSEPGQGTVATIELPRLDRSA